VKYKDALSTEKTDTASWAITVLHPKIDVAKSGPTFAHEGDHITYDITVTNTGDCPLYSVSVTDTLLGGLTAYLPDTTLDVDEVDQFTVNYIVPHPSTVISNTVTAYGSDILGGVKGTVSDSASSTVTVTAPPPSVGGEWAPIMLRALSPVNTLQLLAPWIGLASTIAIAATFVAIRRIKKRQN
jgi:uncharacterized repeat protein (TIGR01451 family)